MTDLTAIDVLIDPDEATMERARAVNARMLQSLPEGWALERICAKAAEAATCGPSRPPTMGSSPSWLGRLRVLT